MEEVLTTQCVYCGQDQNISYKFCTSCGKANSLNYKKQTVRSNQIDSSIKHLVAYILITVLPLLALAFAEDTFEVLLISTIIYAILDLGLAFSQNEVWSLFSLKNVQIRPLILITLICVLSGFIVSISMDYLNLLIFEETADGYMLLFEDKEYGLALAILLIAVFPAVFEELAFRGFIYNNLNAIGGKIAAIWGSAFLFALVHFSLIGILWLIPFALILAHFRRVNNTIIYGIIGHFTHNTTVILIEYYGLFT